MNNRHSLLALLLLLCATIASLAASRAADEILRPSLRMQLRARRQARRSTDTTPMCEVEDEYGITTQHGHCKCYGDENKQTASCYTRYIPELRVTRGRFDSIQFCQGGSFNDNRLSPANFSSFPPIRALDLSECGVRSIAPFTFERLQSLQALILERNNLSDVPPNAFSKVRIERLSIGQNPGLRLTPETFAGADVRTLDLENCALGAEQVNRLSLGPLVGREGSLRTLYLGGNRLQTLDPALRPWVVSSLRNVRRSSEPQSHVLGLADNPLSCNCSLLWLADLARDYPENFKQLSRTNCTLRVPNNVWPPSNVEGRLSQSFDGMVNLSLASLSQYATALGCAPPSLSSLNMVLSESAAWEFKLRVEANPMPDNVLVTRESTLNAATRASGDDDTLFRTLQSLDPQLVARAGATAHVFDATRNTFYADLSVRVEANNTFDAGDYVLLARNHLGKLVFRLETKLARYFLLQQLVQQHTTPAAANLTNLSVLCESVLAGRLGPRMTTAMAPLKAGHAEQVDAQGSTTTGDSSKLFSWFELLISVLLTAIISSAVTFLVASLFMAERPFRLCFCVPFCRRRAQNKQRSLRAPLNSGSNSIFLLHNPVVSYSHVPSNQTPSRQAGVGVMGGGGNQHAANASRGGAIESSVHAEGEAVALVGALNGSAQLSDSPRSAMETSVNMPLYAVSANPNSAGSLNSVASVGRKQTANQHATNSSSGALLLQPSAVTPTDNSVLLTQLIGALCNQLAAAQNTPQLTMTTNSSEPLRPNATHYPTPTLYASQEPPAPPVNTLSPQQLLTLMQHMALMQNANQQGAASLGSGVGSAHMNPSLLSATAQQWARAALTNGGGIGVPYDPAAVGTMGRSRAPSVAGSNPYMTLPHSTNTLSNGNRVSQADSMPPLSFLPPDLFQRPMMNPAAATSNIHSPARQPVNGASYTLGAQSMRLPPFRPLPLNNASGGGTQNAHNANPFSAIGAQTARPHRSSVFISDSIDPALQLQLPSAAGFRGGNGTPQRAVRSTSAMFPLMELKTSASGTGGTGTCTSGGTGTCGEGDYMCASLLEAPDSAAAECLILPPPPLTESPGPQPPPPSRPKLATPSQTPGQSRRT